MNGESQGQGTLSSLDACISSGTTQSNKPKSQAALHRSLSLVQVRTDKWLLVYTGLPLTRSIPESPVTRESPRL